LKKDLFAGPSPAHDRIDLAEPTKAGRAIGPSELRVRGQHANLNGTASNRARFFPFCSWVLSLLSVSNNVLIANHLSSDTGLGTADLGLFTSVYFLVFAGAQIPVGVLLDRFGPRRVQFVLLLLAAAGAGLFAISTDFL
jgi:nitrate/nitrite transporter NarK